jgi:hypothetical protein
MSKKIVTNLLSYARQEGVNDLVITSQEQHIALDCYLPGGAKRSLTLPKKLEQEFFASLRRILNFMPGELITRAYRQIPTSAGELNLYLTILPDGPQEKIMINLLNRPPQLWRLNQLGLRSADLREVKKVIQRRSGLIIVAAPPGQGKSSTLYALLLELNQPETNIYLLAQNPPFIIPGVNLLAPTPANWAQVGRHDSEVILADSLDQDWAWRQAVQLAGTGRLVIGTLTTANPSETKRHTAPNLNMIINQRLVKLARPPQKSGLGHRQIIGSFSVEILKSSR